MRIKRVMGILFLCSVLAFGEEIYTEMEKKDEITYWRGDKGQAIVAPKVTVSKDSIVGNNSVRAEVVDKGDYQGITLVLPQAIDLKDFSGVSFYIKQGYYSKRADCVFRINFEDGFYIYTNFDSGEGDWQKVYIPFEVSRWTGSSNKEPRFEKAVSLTWYPYSVMNEVGQFIMIDGLEFIPKQTSEGKIIINKYQYISHAGTDRGLNLLTDGILEKDKQVTFGAYSDNPDISFDLGGIYKVDKIQIEAIAVPAHNISTITIYSSFDGNKWEQVGGITNTDTEGEEKHQVIEGDNLSIVGRYIRLKFERLRGDFPINIGEVTFYGRIANEKDMSEFALKTYSIGPDMPELNKENYWVIKEGKIEVWINKENGVIGCVLKGKDKIIERVLNEYVIAREERDRRVMDIKIK